MRFKVESTILSWLEENYIWIAKIEMEKFLDYESDSIKGICKLSGSSFQAYFYVTSQ